MTERTTEEQHTTAANPRDGEARDTKPPFKELPNLPIKAGRGIRNLDPKLLDKELPNRPITARRGVRNRPKPPAS